MCSLNADSFNTGSPDFFSYTAVSKIRRGPIYFITITNRRKKQEKKKDFLREVNEAFDMFNYPSQVYGYVEYASSMKWHIHAFSHHKYPHIPRHSNIHIHVIPVDDASFDTMHMYMQKGQLKEKVVTESKIDALIAYMTR